MVGDIWRSFRRVPMWVQVWIMVFLVPANILPLAFLDAPYGLWVAVLSIGGMLPNLFIMIAERGVSKRMALPHLIIWTPLVIGIGWLLLSFGPLASGQVLETNWWRGLAVVFLVDLLSLMFDYVDGWKWWRGDRAVA